MTISEWQSLHLVVLPLLTAFAYMIVPHILHVTRNSDSYSMGSACGAGGESLPIVAAEAPNPRIASNAFFFFGALESDARIELSVNWDSSSSSAAEISGPKLFPLDCDAKPPAFGGSASGLAGVSMGGSDDSEKNESSSSGNGVSF